jgi:hypothetical protein
VGILLIIMWGFVYAPVYYEKWFGTPPAATQGRVILPSVETTFTVTAKKGEWTQTYQFPLTMKVECRTVNPQGRFAMKTQSGTYSFTPEKSDEVKHEVAEASFTALGDSPEEIRIRLYR